MKPTIKKYIHRKNIVFQEVESVIYILDEKNDKIVTLNDTATLLWKQLSKSADIKQLVSLLTNHYSVSEKQSEHDVLQFLKTMQQFDFISEAK